MKKIAVCGKGGVGKSFIVYLLANLFIKKGYSVLVVDSDESNMTLHKLFGFPETPKSFMDYLGGRRSIQQRMMRRFQTQGGESKMKVIEKDSIRSEDIPDEYIKRKDGLSLISVGKIKEPLEGCACPMGVISRELLEVVEQKDDGVVLVDTEAGLEHFGRGIESGIDTVIVVSEPYVDSIKLAQKALELSKEMGKEAYLIVNKVPVEFENKVRETIRNKGMEISGIIHFSPEVYSSSIDGKIPDNAKVAKEVEEILNKIWKSSPSNP
jgi:CO dehydrogenase maturation factor